MNRQLRADIALASVTLLRGVSYLLVDIALAETEPFTLNFIRFFGAFVIAAAAFFPARSCRILHRHSFCGAD